MREITFVVPCYNSQDYMRRCIDSLLPCGERAEIIIVDDGSTDATGEIADEYAAVYPKIVKVVHKENGGHGSGVNVGLKLASGRFSRWLIRMIGWIRRRLQGCWKVWRPSGIWWIFWSATMCTTIFMKKTEKC